MNVFSFFSGISAFEKVQKRQEVVVNGKMVTKILKEKLEKVIYDTRIRCKRYMFATYALAKEGLDIPRLDRLLLVTHQKEYAVIVQSVGRVAKPLRASSNLLFMNT